MFHSIKDGVSAIAERILFVFLGGITALIFVKKVDNTESDTDVLTFVVGDHCRSEVKKYLDDLNAEFTTSIKLINYDNGEFPAVAAVAEIRHDTLGSTDLERYANGAMAKCWTNSFSEFKVGNHEDMVRAVDYVSMLHRHGDYPILISVDLDVMTVRTNKTGFWEVK